MGSLSSPCWWELLFHGWGVCSAHKGTALKLLGSIAPVVNYRASCGWKLPWRSGSGSVWCVWLGWGVGARMCGFSMKEKEKPAHIALLASFLLRVAWDSSWPCAWNAGKRRSKEGEVDLNSFLPSFLQGLAVLPVTCLINSFPCIEITPFRRIRVIWSAVINPSSFDAKLGGPSWELGWQVGKRKWEHRCRNRILWLWYKLCLKFR